MDHSPHSFFEEDGENHSQIGHRLIFGFRQWLKSPWDQQMRVVCYTGRLRCIIVLIEFNHVIILQIYTCIYIYIHIYHMIDNDKSIKWLKILSRQLQSIRHQRVFFFWKSQRFFCEMILHTELQPPRFWHFLLHESLGRLLLGSFLLVPWRIHETAMWAVWPKPLLVVD